MTNFNTIPKVNPDQLCKAWNLCSVREKNTISMIAIKYLDGKTIEIPLSEIINIDSYKWLTIERTYSSGHVFLDKDLRKVYLISVEKRGHIQYQFTWGAPREQIFSEIIYTEKSDSGVDKNKNTLKVNITKVEDNALERTLLRTWVKVTESYNTMPLVDRVLLENEREDKDWNTYKFWRLVLLMHFVVKKYEWTLKPQNWVENVVGWGRYEIDTLSTTDNVAANAYIVSKKAQETVKIKK